MSHFNQIMGPEIFLQAPESEQDEEIKKIPSLMDMYDKDFFFMQISAKIQSANLIFNIPSKYARGKLEMLMISIVVDINSELNRHLAQELLEAFIEEIKKIDDVYEAFYVGSTKYKGDSNKLQEISNLFYSFAKSFEPVINAIKDAELRYEMLFKSARDPILIVDHKSGVIVDANLQAKKVLTIFRNEILGLPVSELFFAEDYDKIETQISKMISTADSQPIEARVNLLNENIIHVDITASEIEIGDQIFIQMIFRDISEKKKAKEVLIQSQKKYKLAFKQANFYKDLFTYDMNNILQNINSSIDLITLISENPKINGNKKENLKLLKEQVLKGKKLISTVEKLSRVEKMSKSLEKVEACGVLKEAIAFLHKNFHERIVQIKVESIIKSFHVKANELLLILFENILMNASKHNKNSIVSILIKVSTVDIKDKDFLRIEFMDNGIGIEEKEKEMIFNRNYSDGSKVNRRGFGLYMVKNIINSYKGEIWIEDKVKGDHEKGSNFILLIPRA